VADVLLGAVESVGTTARSGPDRPPLPPIEVDLSDPTLVVSGDAHHLVRLFTNLLENAVRHTPPGGHIRLSAAAREEDTVTVTVEDTGEGIPPEHLPRVLERFYRVDDSRTRASGGTGLGLAICQSIVQAHGGSLTIQSEVGQGTRVVVTLPRAAPAAPAAHIR
jgi:signal transduction histidine kinase